MTNLYFQGGIKKEVAKLPSSFRPLKTTISQTKKEQLTTLQFFWRCAWIAPARSEFWAVRHSLCTLTFLGPVLKDGSPLASLEEKLWTSQNILTNTQNRWFPLTDIAHYKTDEYINLLILTVVGIQYYISCRCTT